MISCSVVFLVLALFANVCISLMPCVKITGVTEIAPPDRIVFGMDIRTSSGQRTPIATVNVPLIDPLLRRTDTTLGSVVFFMCRLSSVEGR
jgi:hypothetical protein